MGWGMGWMDGWMDGELSLIRFTVFSLWTFRCVLVHGLLGWKLEALDVVLYCVHTHHHGALNAAEVSLRHCGGLIHYVALSGRWVCLGCVHFSNV
jgi:hypothetical protein